VYPSLGDHRGGVFSLFSSDTQDAHIRLSLLYKFRHVPLAFLEELQFLHDDSKNWHSPATEFIGTDRLKEFAESWELTLPITVVVNGKRVAVASSEELLPYESILTLAGYSARPIITYKYSNGHGSSLFPGELLHMTDGLVINVAMTSGA
jgi:hypothetical protein